ncbi:MAG: periplasmic heavy metal sensor [Acidobacteriota bacterium]
MKKLMLILGVLVAASPVVANDFDLPPGKWWENPRLVEHIGLSEGQQDQIRDVIFSHAKRMIDLKADVERAALDLADVVDQEVFDPDPVRAAYAVFQTARHKLENERFEMLLEVRQILTYEQWRKIQDVKQRTKQNRMEQRRPGARGTVPQGERPPGF